MNHISCDKVDCKNNKNMFCEFGWDGKDKILILKSIDDFDILECTQYELVEASEK